MATTAHVPPVSELGNVKEIHKRRVEAHDEGYKSVKSQTQLWLPRAALSPLPALCGLRTAELAMYYAQRIAMTCVFTISSSLVYFLESTLGGHYSCRDSNL